MSYPQPDSNKPVLVGSSFFRIKTAIASAGDIYESQQSGVGFAIGPDSEISRANIGYFDENNSPTFLSAVEITPERMFVGTLNARNEPTALYQPSKRQGRILVWPTDLWDPNYFPVGFNNLNDRIFRANPILDVVEYFSNVPFAPPSRSDRTYSLQNVGNNAGHQNWFIFPFYGRSWAMIEFTNRTGDTVTYEVRGVNFSIEDSTVSPPLGVPQAQETQLVASGVVANNGNNTKIVKSSSDGQFDVLAVAFNVNTVGTPLVFRLIVSDTPR